jgi:hypothetical protein
VFLQAPDSYVVLADSPREISGIAYGQIDDLALSIDGQSAGRPVEGDGPSEWVLPLTRPLRDGIHRVRVVATGPAGSAGDGAIVAIGDWPFTIGFVPEQLVVDRAVEREDPVPIRLGVLGPPSGEGYTVSLVLESAGGLTFDVFPFDALESTSGFFTGPIEPVETGQGVFVDLAIDHDTPLGEHRLTVRADGPEGTEPQRASFTLDVVDSTAAATQGTGPVAPGGGRHTDSYRIGSHVTESDTPDSVGERSNATWRLTFDCADGRCDAAVTDGGPRGDLAPFTARYRSADEAYRFEVTQALEGEGCSARHVSGQIEPTAWDARGPVRFAYDLVEVTVCDAGNQQVTWEGTGRRR